MATLQLNPFSSWNLTPEEHLAGSRFNDLQVKVIQNEIAIAAQAKLSLTFDPQNPLSFAQAEAELAGKIGILQYLLSQSEAAQTNP